jgi:uncharacterized membrane protein
MMDCRSCGEHIRSDPEAVGARCPRCREPLYERGGGPRLADEPGVNPDAAVCAVHAGNLAVGTCQRCGNFVCRVCRTRWHELPLCLGCVERAVQDNEGDPAEVRGHRRQALWSLILGLLAWGGLVLTGPLLVVAGSRGNEALAVLVMVVTLFSMLPSAFGVGLGAAAVRGRGDRMILATCGLVLSALHLGTLAGLLLVGIARH